MRDHTSDYLDDDLLDAGEPMPDLPDDDSSLQRPRLRRRSRADATDRETLKQLIRDIPNFLKLLARLYRDARVSRFDKGIVLATMAYVVMPMDFIPDWLPFLGQMDDLYLMALALDRLLNNAGVEVLLDHWEGKVASLETAIAALDKAGSFLPEPIRALLHQKVS